MSISEKDAEKFKSGLVALVEEAYRLRFSTDAAPKPGEGPAELLHKLIVVRKSMDRMEELLFNTLRIKGNIHRVNTDVQAEAEDDWDRAVQASRREPVVRGSDMVGPRERYADANLATLEKRRTARRVAALASVADESTDVIKLSLRGLDGTRQDLNTALRALQFESSLDR